MPDVEHPASALQAQARFAALGSHGAFVGGGTALQLGWGAEPPAITLLDVTQIPAAHGITLRGSMLRIGAAVRLETLRRDVVAGRHAPLLVEACNGIAALSVRHLATLGGNVAWGYGDTLPVLLALGALAEGAGGDCVPLLQWLERADGSLLVALQLDVAQQAAVSFFEKVGHRAAFSPSRLALALRAVPAAQGRLHGVHAAVSGSGLRARRLAHVERVLDGSRPGDPIEAVLRDACAVDLADAPSLARVAAAVLAGRLAGADRAH